MPRANGGLRGIKPDLRPFFSKGNDLGWRSLKTVADPRFHIQGRIGFFTDPVDVPHQALRGQGVLCETDGQAVVFNIDDDNIVRFTGRALDAASLAEGKQMQSGMLTDDAAPGVLYGPGGCIEPGQLHEKVAVLVAMDETDILTFAGGDRFEAG